MRGQSLKGLIEYEAKRRPEIKELLDRVETLTDDEIENAAVPLPWFKQALRQVRAVKQKELMDAYILANTVSDVVPDPLGSIAEYKGPDTYVQATSGMSIELKTGTLVWFPEDGGVWIETTFCRVIAPCLVTASPVKKAHKTEYSALYRARINARY